MITLGVLAGVVGLATFCLVNVLKLAVKPDEPDAPAYIARVWPVVAVGLGVGLAFIPGALEFAIEVSGSDVSVVSSPAAKVLVGIVGGGTSTWWWGVWRKTVLGK